MIYKIIREDIEKNKKQCKGRFFCRKEDTGYAYEFAECFGGYCFTDLGEQDT